jgi:cobalt-zinc-cadmium efflux system membrane fusion protein
MSKRKSIPAKPQHALLLLLILPLAFTGCKKQDEGDGAPPAAQLVQADNASLITVNNPDQFPLAAATGFSSALDLRVTGAVAPDVARTVPVITLANGRVVDVRVRLGDTVKKGQLIMRVQSSDVSGAFDTYLKAVNDEHLAAKALTRAQTLYDHGAVSQSQLEQAEDAEQDARADRNAADEQLKTLGVDKDHPGSTVNVYAPISGVIVQQNVTNAAAAGAALSGSPNAFMIANLSTIWVLCDVYENDIAGLHLGQTADIHPTAFPDKTFSGKISDIGPVLDPNIRTAKVRIEIPNPNNLLRVGMFVNATFHGNTAVAHAAVPATAVLHLHDSDWVYTPADNHHLKRIPVVAGRMLPGNLQEIVSGLSAGQQVVSNSLALQSTVEQ